MSCLRIDCDCYVYGFYSTHFNVGCLCQSSNEELKANVALFLNLMVCSNLAVNITEFGTFQMDVKYYFEMLEHEGEKY